MKKLSILILEDEPITALNLKDIAENNGYHVILCYTSGQAFDYLNDPKMPYPNLALLDIELVNEKNGRVAVIED